MLFNEPWYLSLSLFERTLACINLAAFLSSLSQWRGQIGSTGILPAYSFVRYWKERICFLGCWLCYSSLVTVSTTFMGLQMHSNLLETNMLYVLCSPFLAAQPEVFVFIQWTLLFRIMLGGAVGKYTGGDRSWKDGSAMLWHYWTQ
ncbi:unnamed protein product [Rotaria sp. Silwood1]|nr:unnamed protein product [Rotaria sp. Silwood1]CAF4995396.1 unnamed protein product [Rotaria sp. Silwood1]